MSKVIDQDGTVLGEVINFQEFNYTSAHTTVIDVEPEAYELPLLLESNAELEAQTHTNDAKLNALIYDTLELKPLADDDGSVVRAIILYSPLDLSDRTVCDLVWEDGKTLDQYLEGLPEGDWSVSVGSRGVEKSEWKEFTLSPLDTVVIGLVPNKSILSIVMIVAMVALAVAAPYLIPIIGTVGVALLGIAVSVGGMLLNSLLADKPKDPNGSTQKESASYGLDGAKNTSQETLAVPVIYGKMRVAGNKVNVYVENNSDALTQTIFSQFVVGEGEIENISDVLLNDQPIQNFQGAIWDWRNGTQTQAPMQWFSESIRPHNVQVKVTPNHFIYQTVDVVDRVRIDFAFPNGLFSISSKTGKVGDATVALRMMYRRINADGSLGDPQLMSSDLTWNKIDASTTNTNLKCTGLRLTVLVTGNNDEQFTPYSCSAEYQQGIIGSGWVAFGNESGVVANVQSVNSDDSHSFTAGTTLKVFEVSNLPKDNFNFRANGGVIVGVEAQYVTDLTYTDSTRGTSRRSISTPPLDRGRYRFEFWRDTPESTDSTLSDALAIVDINEIKDDLVRYANTAYYATQIHLGADINQEPNVTALVTGKRLNIYDRNGNVAAYRYSNNPSDIALDVMLNARHRFAFNATRIDFAAFDDWRTYCSQNNLWFNGVFDTTTNVWDALMTIMRVGRGSPILQGLRWSVLIEAPADPVMMFTQDNIIKGSFTSTWTGRKGRANLIEVQYSDVNDNYKQHSAFALDESFIAQNEALVQSTVQLRGVTDLKQAQDEATLQLNLNRYLTQSAEFDVYLQAMGCVVGDVILVQHDMPQWGYSARIINVPSPGFITIDSDIPFDGGGDWRFLLVRGTALVCNGTITSITGKQIEISGLTQSSIGSSDSALVQYSEEDGSILNPVSLSGFSPNEAIRATGVDRVIINGVDYNVVDSVQLDNRIILTSDTNFITTVGSTAELFKNDMMCEAEIITPAFNSRILGIAAWRTLYGAPRVGDIIMIGQVERFKKPFRLVKLTYKDDHTRTLTCLEYNDSVYGPNAHPTHNYSALSLNPYQVANLRGHQIATQLQGGAMQYVAHFDWDRPLNDPRGYAGSKVYQSVNFSPLTLVADVTNPISAYEVGASIGDVIRIKVVAYERSQETANYAAAPIAALEIGTHSQKPAIPTGLVATGGIRQIALRWDPMKDDFVRSFQVWENTTSSLSQAYLMYEGKANYYVRANLNPNEERFYWLRTIAITDEQGDFIGPVNATTSQLIADDIQNGILDTAKFADTISPVALFDGVPTTLSDTKGAKIAFNTADGKIYRWTGLGFSKLIDIVDVPGVALASDVAAINNALTTTYLTQDETNALIASHNAGALTDEQLATIKAATVSGLLVDARLNASSIVGQLTDAQIASLTFDKITGTFTADKLTDVDPATGNQISGVSASRLIGNIPATKIVDVNPLTGVQSSGISAAKILGTINQSAIPNIPTSKLVGDILANAGASLNLSAATISGTLSAANTASLNLLSGKITSTQITDNAITSPMISAGAVNAKLIGAYALTADNIASGAITTAKLSVGSVNNAIANSCFYASSEGWTLSGATLTPVIGTPDEINFGMNGLGAGKLVSSEPVAPGGYIDFYYNAGQTATGRAFNASVPAMPNETWEAQVAYSSINGGMQIILLMANSSNGLVGTISPGVSNFAPVSSAKSIAEWHTVVARGIAAANTVAVGMTIRLINMGSSPAILSCYVTRALLGKTVPNATENLPWTPGGVTSITGGIIRTDAITSRNIVAGAISTIKLAAGSITAEKLAIGSSNNVIWNPSCMVTTDGWLAGGNISVALNCNLPGNTVNGEGTGFISSGDNLAVGQSIYAKWAPTGQYGTPVRGGTWVEAQAMVSAHRCAAYVSIQFYDVNFNIVSSSASARCVGAGAGVSLSGYQLGWVKTIVPPTAVSACLYIYGINDGNVDYTAMTNPAAAGVTPYVFFTRALFGASTPVEMSLSQPQVWAPGGVTEITGGIIKSDTIIGRHIIAGSITTDKLTVGTSANVIWNSCLTGSTDGWVVGNDSTGGTGKLSFNSDGSSQYLVGFGSGTVYSATNIGSGFVDANWWPNLPYKGVACKSGQVWEAQAQVIAAGCSCQLMIDWYNAANVLVGQTTGAITNGPTDTGNGGLVLPYYTKLSFIGVAPVNAVFASLNVRMRNGLVAGAYVTFSQVMLALTVPNAQEVSAWAPGGATQISGGAIRTNSIYARTLAANQITARELSVGNSSNLISNSCCAVTGEDWSVGYFNATAPGGVQAAAIVAPQYATSEGAGFVYTNIAAGGFVDVSGLSYPCKENDWFEAQAMILPIASRGMIYMAFSNNSGATTGYSQFSNKIEQQSVPSSALTNTLTPFSLVSVIAKAPAGTTRVRLIIRYESPQNSEADGYGIFTRTALGYTVANATQVSAWSAGGMTSIGGGIIKTNAIVARNIVAGAVTAEKITVASASNVIYNPSCFVSTDGWTLYNSPSVVDGKIGIAGVIAPTSYVLSGEGTGCISASSLPVGQFMTAYWDGGVGGIACLPGEWWEVQAYMAAHRCYGVTEIQFMDANNNTTLSARGTRVAGPIGGNVLQNYGLSWTKAKAPAGTVRVRVLLYAQNDGAADIYGGAAGQNPYLFFTHAVLGKSNPLAIELSQPQPYQIGGATSISGGMIRTGAIESRTIAANAITADKIQANSITSIHILANSIQAEDIGAGQITAEKLAIGSPSNVIGNPTCQVSNWGWRMGGSAQGANYGSVIGDNIAPAVYALAGEGSGCVSASSMSTAQNMYVFWDPDNIGGVPCKPGEWWELQSLIGAHRCAALVQLQFFDATGGYLQNTDGDRIVGYLGGARVIDYGFSWCKAQAPANAAFVRGYIAAFNNGSDITQAGQTPYLFFTRVVLGRSTSFPKEQGAQPQAYQIGGVTQIIGAQIKTGSITAKQANISDLTAAIITARSITADKIAVGTIVADNLAANSVTTAKISAGAVVTQSIAAGAITAEKLVVGAANNVIWNSCFRVSSEGWVLAAPGNQLSVSGPVINTALNPTWNLIGSGTCVLSIAGTLANGSIMDAYWGPDGTAVPVTAGQWWVGQARMQTHRSCGYVYIQWLDGNGKAIYADRSSRLTTLPTTDGRILGYYSLVWVCGQAPAQACYARLIVRAMNDGGADIGGGVNPYLFFTQAALGQVTNNVVSPPVFAEGGVTTLSDGAIKTNSIGARSIAAGAITTEKLAVGSGNVIWNSCCINGVDGWAFNGYGGIETISSFIISDKANIVSDSFVLNGYGTGVSYLNIDNLISSSQGWVGLWYPSGRTPASAGVRYQGAMLLQPHRCTGAVTMVFLDGAGNAVGQFYGNTIGNLESNGSAIFEYQYQRSEVIATAPPNTVGVYLRWVATGIDGVSHRPYLFFTKAMLSEAPINAFQVGPWTPGGVTEITGGVIRSDTIQARHITANAIDADSLQANSVIFGKVAAGAIRADQIRAGEIRTNHLAADFALISTAQIGDAIISRAKIGDLQVNGQKISPGSATAGSFSKSTYRGNADFNNWTTLAIVANSLDNHSTGFMIIVSCLNDYLRDNNSDSFNNQAGEGSGGDQGGGGGDGS